MKESSFRELPDVQFKNQLLLVLQGNTPGSFVAYSTFQNFNQLLQQNLRIPIIKVKNSLRTFVALAHIVLHPLDNRCHGQRAFLLE